MLVATPSGVTLAPEGGAHQSVVTPLIGMGQPGLTAFEPALRRRAGRDLRWSLRAPPGRRRRLGLPPAVDPPVAAARAEMTPSCRDAVLAGGYWLRAAAARAPSWRIVCAGAVAPEAIEAHAQIREDIPGGRAAASPRPTGSTPTGAGSGAARGTAVGRAARRRSAADAALVTVLDGHPATLSWLGAVRGHRACPLGVDQFGQSADVVDLYRLHGLDEDAILDACACVHRATLAVMMAELASIRLGHWRV